jgi:outer membrane protein OmpA-like peptidoglycan-associated protein
VKNIVLLLGTWAAFALVGAPASLAQATAPQTSQAQATQQQSAASQSNAQQGTQSQDSSPLYRVTVIARTTKAINYRHLSGPTKIDFAGTVLMPLAKGDAGVESKRGAIRIQAKFEKLQPAQRFGPEFLTYVLWAVSPEGRADNLGEVQLDGTKSKLDVTTQLQAFALIVTAEPYFAVTQPSEVVVLENIVRPDTVGGVEEMDAKFDLLQRSQYTMVQNSASTARAESGVPLGLAEARNAIQIAQAAGAQKYASDSYQKAAQLLKQAEELQQRKSEKKGIEMAAREAVQTAEDARSITVKRVEDERLAAERQAAADREAKAKADAENAEKAKLEAELAAERAAREKAEAEAARVQALAQQQAAQAEAEKSRLAAEQAAREKAEADAARANAEAQQAAARDQAAAAQAQAAAAQVEAEAARKAAAQAEADKAALRAQLLSQLNTILQTRDSARGLIVNMSDVLFDTGSYTLKPGAREKLAKISGIVLAHPGLNLQIEGHTDSVGGDEFNQNLSERRAGAVRDFLIDQGLGASTVGARGFGKTQPVATNDTAEGRQRNRRVEIVVNGAAIGNNASASTAAPAAQQNR